jgi:hypothetical protein
MRIHTPSPKPKEDGEFEVRVNPGDAAHEPFAMIALDERSDTEICLDDLDDARRLVRAAVKALHRLETSVKGEPHPYRDDAYRCDECGQARTAAIHAAPEPLVISDATIAQARAFAQPGNTVDDILKAAS